MSDGEPISYKVLRPGTAVRSADGAEVGHVERVLEVPEEQIFDGIVIRTPSGERFVDAPDVDGVYERAVVLTITAEEAASLPEPTAAAPVYRVDPGYGRGIGGRVRRFFGGGGWRRR
jgi:hypothetical protein